MKELLCPECKVALEQDEELNDVMGMFGEAPYACPACGEEYALDPSSGKILVDNADS